jgi:hypothetical protein
LKKPIESSEKMKKMGFEHFMSSFEGRLLRIVMGIALIVIGLAIVHGTGGVILAIIGLIPLVAGLGNFFILAPLFGGRLSPKAVPAKINNRRRY